MLVLVERGIWNYFLDICGFRMMIRSFVIFVVEWVDEIVWVGKDLCLFRFCVLLIGGEI